jgi:hypothetical protein
MGYETDSFGYTDIPCEYCKAMFGEVKKLFLKCCVETDDIYYYILQCRQCGNQLKDRRKKNVGRTAWRDMGARRDSKADSQGITGGIPQYSGAHPVTARRVRQVPSE